MEKSYELFRRILKNQNVPPKGNEDNQNIVLEDHHYKPTQGILSKTFFLGLGDQNAAEKSSTSLFMKISKPTAGMESYNISAFFNEAYFYSKIVPFFQTFGDTTNLFYNYLGSSLNIVAGDEKCAMVAENLQDEGYQHPVVKCRWDYPHLAIVMQKLGEFHAFSYKAKVVDSRRFHSLVANLNKSIELTAIMLIEILKRNWRGILENVRKDRQFVENYASSLTRAEYILENMLPLLQKQFTVDRSTAHNLVLCHGDFCNFNFMFQYENEKPRTAKLFDFANCTLGYPALDVLFILYCATDEKMRHDHWDDLINCYYTSLSTTFSDNVIPTKSSIINDFALQALFPSFIGINFAPYLMAIDELGADVPENMPLSELEKIGETKAEERVVIFKDMVRRNLF